MKFSIENGIGKTKFINYRSKSVKFGPNSQKTFSYNVSDSTTDYFVAQGINVIYASMAASASYDFIIDVSPPQVHFERKSFLKSDKLDFTFGKWTYYKIPFGGFQNGFKTKVRAKNGKLIEKIINLGMF